MGKWILKYKEEYRCRSPYDLATGEFPRNADGSLADDDIYIECDAGMIYEYSASKGLMTAYFDSREKGLNVAMQIYNWTHGDFDSKYVTEVERTRKKTGETYIGRDTNWDLFIEDLRVLNLDCLIDVRDSDKEFEFVFKEKLYFKEIAKLMKAKKPKANKSPYNIQYLPKYKEKYAEKKAANAHYRDYKTPVGYWDEMKVILPAYSKLTKIKLGDCLDSLVDGFERVIEFPLRRDAELHSYKITHWILHFGVWDKFVEYCQLQAYPVK